MADRPKVATISPGKASLCVIFRHPVCRTPDGREFLRVRRGLGTKVQAEAEALVGELNQLLSDPSYWNVASRGRAAAMFDEKVVAAFYDHMSPPSRDPWQEREDLLPLPGGKEADDGYCRAMLIGTTGAGKTTVVRQLIGTDPVEERFPSISAAKTTVCDMEIVLADGPFRAVVSFIDRDLVRQYIADCVLAAVVTALNGRAEGEVARRLLEHSDQRFRLSYLLGTLRAFDEDELSDDDGQEELPGLASDDPSTAGDQERLRGRLQEHLSEIKTLAEASKQDVRRAAKALGVDLSTATQVDRDAVQEIVEDELGAKEEFHALVDEILDDVESRFELLSEGEVIRHRDGWPRTWTYSDANRAQFLRLVNRFSSNFAPHFGRLLTPLVDGIRVSGPFSPGWGRTTQPRLVILDGQGLGHTADSTTSISTKITRRFQIVDAIVLVDNAAQPMQAAPCSAVESLVSSGHESKLILCFTHFDEVKGDNLVGTSAKKDHVLGSWDNVVAAIAKSHGRDAENALRRVAPERVVFLSNVQNKVKPDARLTRHELERLVDAIERMIEPTSPVEYAPVYDVANLVLSIQAATMEFHDRWHGILSMGSRSGVAPEHWTRVKALTRRLGLFRVDEYDNLRPVADLIRLLQSHLSRFLSNPYRWNPSMPPEEHEARTVAIDAIRKEAFARLHELSKRRVLDERFSGWMEAFEHRGEGSTRVRARDIVRIYESAAPVPNEMPGPDANEFLLEVRELVADAVLAGGGHLIGWKRPEMMSEAADSEA